MHILNLEMPYNEYIYIYIKHTVFVYCLCTLMLAGHHHIKKLPYPVYPVGHTDLQAQILFHGRSKIK